MLSEIEIMERLRDFFPASDVQFKPGVVNGNRALALAYIDARTVMDRLDEALGCLGWQDSYTFLPDGSAVCSLSVKVGAEWATKMDVGAPSEQKDEGDRRKASVSDALKRAAVKFGVGRYLYSIENSWHDFDPQRKRFLKIPELPSWARLETRQKALAILRQAKGLPALKEAWKVLSEDMRLATGDLLSSLKQQAMEVAA